MGRYKIISLIVLFLISSSSFYFFGKNSLNVTLSSKIDGNKENKINARIRDETLTLKLEFIGFNEELINTSKIEEQLYSSFDFNNDIPYSRFLFNFEFNFLSESVYSNMETYIKSIANNGTATGYEVNTTQLALDLSSGERNQIFIPIDGMSIDAKSVEEYIYDNLYSEPAIDNPGYALYLLNFSKLDKLDHSLEHWYDITGTSLDSNQSDTWWYSGYSDLEKRAAAGWGGKYRFCYLDLSARSWFFDFITTAWSGSMVYDDALYYDFPDLDALAQYYDIRDSEGEEKLHEYIWDWINAYLANVFSGPVYDPPIGESFSMQVIVFNNLTINGFSEDTLKWCISEERIRTVLSNDISWLNWDIEIVWRNLTDYPTLYNYIQENYQQDVNGKYIEVTQGLFYLLQTQLDVHFDLLAADEVLPCYFFLTNDLHFKYMGISFAGLGGMGWEILLGTQNTLFEDANISQPRRGMSAVMIHELGHSLGLPHPHSDYGWGSAFVSDVMSYFAYDYNFSSFYKDALGRSHTDAHLTYAQQELAQAIILFNTMTFSTEINSSLAEIEELINEIPNYYQQMNYSTSAKLSIQARNLLETLFDSLINPSTTTKKGNFEFSFLILCPVIISVTFLIFRKKKIK